MKTSQCRNEWQGNVWQAVKRETKKEINYCLATALKGTIVSRENELKVPHSTMDCKDALHPVAPCPILVIFKKFFTLDDAETSRLHCSEKWTEA